MFVITLRSIVLATVALFTVALSVAAAQEAQPTVPALAEDDDAALILAEPDFRVLNLPSTLRLPIRGSSFQLTHRFNGNLRQGSFGENGSNLFGLDQGAVVGFEYRFGIARHLQAAVYRTGLDKTLQFYGKYDALRQGASIPVSLSAVVSVEGADNFQERYAPALAAAVSRTVADRLAVYATPVWVHNTAANLEIDRDTFFVGLGGRVRVSSTVYVVGEVAPRAAGYRPDKPVQGNRGRGDRVQLRVRSADRAHGVGIKAFRVKALIPSAGETVIVEFVADRAGTFDISCSEYCGSGHAAMKGRLIVAAKTR